MVDRLTPWEAEIDPRETTRQNDPLALDNNSSVIINDRINLYGILSYQNKDANDLTWHYKLNPAIRNYIIELLIGKFGDMNNAAKHILHGLESYRGKRYSSEIKEKYRIKKNIEQGIISLEYARIVSLILAETQSESIDILTSLLEKSSFLETRGHKLKIPLILKDFIIDTSYLAGIISGDGHIDETLEEIIIVDGHRQIQMILQSREFMHKLNRIIESIFGYKGSIKKESGNYYSLRTSCSLLARIMHFMYNIPVGKKDESIRVSPIVKNTDHERLFWRGIFDSDGSIRPGNKEILLSTNSASIDKDLEEFCKKHNISIMKGREGKKFRTCINEESIPIFANLIGSSHPRKQENLIGYLRKGASAKKPVKKTEDDKLDGVISDLVPYKENVYVRLTRKREVVTKKTIHNKILVIEKITGKKVIMVKKPRKNNHFYICSKELVKEINSKYNFVPVWESFDDNKIADLRMSWRI